MATQANTIEAEIQRTVKKLRSVWGMRPDIAIGYCRMIAEYEIALRSERKSREPVVMVAKAG
jgi:hypothetical protein